MTGKDKQNYFFQKSKSYKIFSSGICCSVPKTFLFFLILEEQQNYLQSLINNATYQSMNPDADVTYQTVNLFSSDKCFV